MNNEECYELANELSEFIHKNIIKEANGKPLQEAIELIFVTIMLGISAPLGSVFAEFENNENFQTMVDSILNDFSKDLKERVNNQIIAVREHKLKQEVH